MKKIFTFYLLLSLATTLTANNISISNLVLTGKNTIGQYTMVQFDISWENSWRASTAASNWDAAWVFVKYRVAGGAWQQAWLNDDGHTAPAGSSITPGLLTPGAAFNATTNPGLGAFIYRSANATSSTFTNLGAQLRWNYGANGVANGDQVEIKVFAIEMVYVPAGSFTVGDGTSTSAFCQANDVTTPFAPFTIGVGLSTLQGNSASSYSTNLSARGSLDLTGTTTAVLAAGFPIGYNAFYCMKYEISQQGYVDFLNSLTAAQAAARYPVYSANRYGITVSSGVYSTTNPYVACNYLSWMDGAAYSDWAGLRPMTELEFEKACRGTATPVANEYAWGTATVTSNAYTLDAAGAANEAIATNYSTTAGNANHVTTSSPPDAPLRVGIFAGTTGNTGRVTAGSTYYGIMEMTGNLWERPVTVGNATGRAFTGAHGNGTLSPAGNADISTWPGYITAEVTGATGSGFRGGSFLDNYMSVSDRFMGAFDYSERFNNDGFRGVRTIPPFTCGISTFTINHLASGNVAPVNKTVTYGTVSTTLFGGSKCAITQNLGAYHQATSVSDTTEASAGWYWQFNRKQGYKHDGTTPTPAWTIIPINETSDWVSANDPCTLELGTGWRIPTSNELATASGSWTTWVGPWTSDIKLHAAGYLNYTDGSLNGRGMGGFYWSNTQSSSINGLSLAFESSGIGMTGNSKRYGFSLRCLKDLLPTVTTTAVTSITNGTASSGGNATGDGGSAITARGVCWGTATGPTVALSTKTTDGTGTGTFTSSITGLAASTLYYVRAYATNSAGTSYGNDVSFTTSAPSCFIAGTKISMADGSVKNIEDVLVGDEVKSVNTETMEIVFETVTSTFANPPARNLTKITFSNGQTNTNTKNHPYWVIGKGWSCVDPAAYSNSKAMSAELLSVGDQCQVLENGNLVTVTVTAIEDQPQLTVPTFNLKVDQTNCYFANGVLVHNKA